MGTKSQMQCILHLLQMPIEEQFLGDLGATAGRAGWVRGAAGLSWAVHAWC